MALEIRPFHASDTARLRAICCETAAERPFLPWLEEPRLACEFYLEPYLELESESCFVAALDGQIVGYIVGTRDTQAFKQRERIRTERRLVRLLQIHGDGVLKRRLNHLLSHREIGKMYWKALHGRVRKAVTTSRYYDVKTYPAHCHLQVVPEARRKCVGLGLMLKFHEYLKSQGVPGHHGSVVEEAGKESFSSMLLALRFRVVYEKEFTARDMKTLMHPGVWKQRILIREL